ncbi:hypothetical protein TcasGA2_TC005605 [Tribolium castaneum]|uniref:dCMP deaminase n=1 Tax=Tribolium castaneum TaxID=7070 RepID=D6WX97_TRICA|nr:PREDICTED: uncharacterized protein LOC662274 [Tribolium castaneum]EFA08016.1 hypothetical protein TcasGA2_TC005605 [Tribolium castaneum]|eukprot:XP_973477.1 PREDICTED: uncharacterized protein LOC662274 [Tribolium castaneum]
MATTSRTVHPTADEAIMEHCLSLARKSKDPKIQVGACVVNTQDMIIGSAFNSPPNGWPGGSLPSTKNLPSEHFYGLYVCPTEQIAIANAMAANATLEKCTLYTTHFPCNESAKLIIQTGIKKIVYLNDEHKELRKFTVAREMLNTVGIECEKFSSSDKIVLKNEIIMAFCEKVSRNSKDPKKKVGACVVNAQGQAIGWGFNDMPQSHEDFNKYWENREEKLLRVCHAELNAIVNSKGSLKNAKLYCTWFPCNICAQLIVNTGIKEVFYDQELGPKWAKMMNASKEMFSVAEIKLKQVTPKMDISDQEINDFMSKITFQ